eukprot:SAG11_NODE_546_length_8609_cov_2.338778_4_plen_102_part_00
MSFDGATRPVVGRDGGKDSVKSLLIVGDFHPIIMRRVIDPVFLQSAVPNHGMPIEHELFFCLTSAGLMERVEKTRRHPVQGLVDRLANPQANAVESYLEAL